MTNHEAPSTSTEKTYSRRDALAIGGAVAGALALGASPLRAATRVRRASKVSITIFSFAGSQLAVMPTAFKQWYEEKNPNVSISIYENSNIVGYPLMLAAKQQNPNKPFVNMGFFNAQTAAQGDLDGMWETLDYKSLSNAKDIYPVFQRQNQHGIGIGSDQLGVVVNSQRVHPAPTSWSALWSPQFANQVVVQTYLWQIVYAAAKLNGGSLRNMTPGWNLWAQKAHDQIRLLVPSAQAEVQALTNGTAAITCQFNGTTIGWIRQGAPLQYVPPKEGAIAVTVYLESVKGNTLAQSEVCHDIINKMLSPKWCGGWMNTAIQVPANSKVKIPAEFSKYPAFQKQTVEHLLKLDWQVVAKAAKTWNHLWDQNITAKL